MKAWQFTGTGEPLLLTEVGEVLAGFGEVVVDIKASGLCHTDVGILDDSRWIPELGLLPLTLGHEVAGVISEIGPGVEGYSIGDRVGISPAGATRPGLGRDGGYSSRCIALPADLVPIPDDLDFVQAALGTDAGRASYRAIMVRGQVKRGDRLGIIGLGGLGQIGARIAVLAGADVFVAEIKESIWPLAQDIGVRRVAKDISEFADEGLDVIVDFAGFGTTTAAAIASVKPFGTVVQVGMGKLEATISTADLILRQVTLIGSRGGTVDDIAAVYDLFTTGQLNPQVTRIDFSQIPAGLDQLRRGQVSGRIVAVYDSASANEP